ncbi:hypothetical protein [Sodaliphilus sp.]|uniref:hypothetical protein n=1 Tax=Sodaliphilus sp. TaxID=2815818 RepID=UPI003890A02C
MKKIFTLALVAMIASVSFGQTLKSAKTLEKTTATQKEAIVSTTTTKHKVAPKAGPIEFEATSASAQYYASDGDWYVVLSNSSTAFRFDVVTNNPTPLEMGHTYTLADMDEGYSWYGSSTSNAVGYTAATLTPKQGAEGTDYEATVTLTNGQSYHITYTATAPKTYDVKITQVQSKYYGAPDNDWYFGFGNEDYAFYFDIANQDASGIVLNKVYTLDDMIEDYSWGKVLATESSIVYQSVSFKATEGVAGTDYTVTVVDTRGDTYNLTYTSQALPEPTETVEIVFTTDETELVDASASQGLVQFQGFKEDTGLEAYVTFITDQVAGEYTMQDVYPSYTGIYLDADDYDGVEALDVTATVTEYDNGAYKAEVDYLGANTVLYKLTFNYGDVPTAINDLTTEAGIKAIKTIKNGQVVIVKGEKMYNAAGQAIK